MHMWFKHLFDCRKDEKGYVKCFECGKRMHEDTYKELTTCYSHILEKKKYKLAAGDENNVVIVHPDCHHLYTMQPRKAVNQFNLRLKLLEQYEFTGVSETSNEDMS